MWIIVAISVASQTISPFPHGAAVLFPNAQVCTEAAKLLTTFAQEAHVDLGCKLIHVYGGDKQEAF